eukprot:scaffold5684_cov169-Amphora_coffeaeformis.AAC.1
MIQALLLLVSSCCYLSGIHGFAPQQQQQHQHQSSSAVVGRGQALLSVPNPIDTLTSGLASILRINRGITVNPAAVTNVANTPFLKKLYDIENNPACRRVRERITELDLCVDQVIPCAKKSQARQTLGHEVVLPRLVAEVDGKEVVVEGDDEIINFLNQATGIPGVDEDPILELADIAGNVGATVLRIGRGSHVSPAVGPRPEKPVILYDYAGNQFCRLVREVLLELDIPFALRSAGKGSPRRQELLKVRGDNSTQCPFLVDPNTGVAMGESTDIVRYLYQTYADYTPPSELLQWISENVMALGKPLFENLTPIQARLGDEIEISQQKIENARRQVEMEIRSFPVVMYTYGLSPFSTEAKMLFENLGVDYREISLGQEWLPGLIAEGGAQKRAALLEMTGQSSIPQVFVGGQALGGLFSGTPGLLPALEERKLMKMIEEAQINFVPPPLRISFDSATVAEIVKEKAAAIEAAPISSLPSFFFEEVSSDGKVGEAFIAVESPIDAKESPIVKTLAAPVQNADMVARIRLLEKRMEDERSKRTIAKEETATQQPNVEEEEPLSSDVIKLPPTRPPLKPFPSTASSGDSAKTEAVSRGLLARRLKDEALSKNEVSSGNPSPLIVDPTPTRPPLKSVAETYGTTDPVKAEAVARQLLARRLLDMSIKENPKPSEVVLGPPPPTRPPLKPVPESATIDSVKAELVARKLLARRLADRPKPMAALQLVFEPPAPIPTRPPLKPVPETANTDPSIPELTVTSDPAKVELVARQLLARRLAEKPKPVPPVVLNPLPPTRPPLKAVPEATVISDPAKAELVARQLLARRLTDKPEPVTESPVQSGPPPPTRPPLKPLPETATVSDPTKAEAVARQLLERRLKQEKSVVRAPLDPPPPSRPPLKPAPSVGTTSDPVKTELVARGLLARRLVDKPEPVADSAFLSKYRPPTRPLLKPTPSTTTISDPAKAESVARDILARRIAGNQVVTAELPPDKKQEPHSSVVLPRKWADGDVPEGSSEATDKTSNDLPRLWASTKAWAETDGTSFEEVASSPKSTHELSTKLSSPSNHEPESSIKLPRNWATVKAWVDGNVPENSLEATDQRNTDLPRLWASAKAWEERDGTSFDHPDSSLKNPYQPTIQQAEKLSTDMPPSADPQPDPVVESHNPDAKDPVKHEMLVDSGEKDEYSEDEASVVEVLESVVPETVEETVEFQALNLQHNEESMGEAKASQDYFPVRSDQERFIGSFMFESELKTPKIFFERREAQPHNQVESQISEKNMIKSKHKTPKMFSGEGPAPVGLDQSNSRVVKQTRGGATIESETFSAQVPSQTEPSRPNNKLIEQEKLDFTMMESELKMPKTFSDHLPSPTALSRPDNQLVEQEKCDFTMMEAELRMPKTFSAQISVQTESSPADNRSPEQKVEFTMMESELKMPKTFSAYIPVQTEPSPAVYRSSEQKVEFTMLEPELKIPKTFFEKPEA